MDEAQANELKNLIATLVGTENAKWLAMASFALVIYDHFLTFDDEVAYFWTGPWTASRALFLLNRYYSVSALTLSFICLFAPNLSITFCTTAIPLSVLFSFLGVWVIQVVIVLRIWHIYSSRMIARLSVLVTFTACTAATVVVLVQIWHELTPQNVNIAGVVFTGCQAPLSNRMWHLLLPNLILHTVLYIATTVPALQSRRSGASSPLLDRLMRDGGLFFAIVFASATFASVGAMVHDPKVLLPAIYSNNLLATSSTAVSRLMLSIHSLASELSLDPDWLLNNAELSRVRWKKGSRPGEIIVEVDHSDDDLELQGINVVDGRLSKGSFHHAGVISTRVGVYEDVVLPGPNNTRPRKKSPKPTIVAFDLKNSTTMSSNEEA